MRAMFPEKILFHFPRLIGMQFRKCSSGLLVSFFNKTKNVFNSLQCGDEKKKWSNKKK